MDKQANILYVTQTLGHKAACGIGIMGDTIGNLLKNSSKYNIHVLYTDDPKVVSGTIEQLMPALVAYNFGAGTTAWVNSERWLRDMWTIPHVKLYHDYGYQELIDTYQPENWGGFKYMIMDDPTLIGNKYVKLVPRCIPLYTGPVYPYPEVPTIGFQGFGPPHKGIARLAAQIQQEFDTAIFRLHIPFGFYGDPSGNDARKRVEECRSIITKTGITIEATHDLWPTHQILEFLAQNTINCYFYDALPGCGLASSPDYAIAVKRPIAVTKSHQLRNFFNLTPSVCIEDRSLKDIIATGTAPLQPLHEAYAPEVVLAAYEKTFEDIINAN